MAQMVIEMIGMKAFKDVLDGKPVDSGTLYSNVKLDHRYNKPGINFKAGDAVEEWKLGSADIVFRIAHLNPSKSNPILMRLEIERLSNGKETKEIVMDAVPVEQPKLTPAKP